MNAPSIGRRLPGIIFAIVVLLFALASFPFSFYPYGSAVWARSLVSLAGIAGALFLLTGIGWWRVLLTLWCLVQSFIVATDASGEWFYQGFMLGLSFKQESTVKGNNLLIDYSASGVTTTGLVLLLVLLILMIGRLHPPVRRLFPGWKSFIIVVVLVMLGTVSLRIWERHQEQGAAFVLKIRGFCAPIYYQDRLLGYSPLCITPERVVKWKLPLNSKGLHAIDGTGWADYIVLLDDKTQVPLFVGAPLLGSGSLDPFDTPWGKRYRVSINESDKNLSKGFFYPNAELRGDPVITINFKGDGPIQAGRPFQLHCVLTNPTSKSYNGRKSDLTRICQTFGPSDRKWTPPPASIRRVVELPESWNTLEPGARVEGDVEFDAPQNPGDYELFCPWYLYKKGTTDGSGSGSAYSNILMLRVVPPQANPTSTAPVMEAP